MSITKSVHYAQSYSPAAADAGYRDEGCFYVRIDNPETGVTIRPFPTLADAEAFGNAEPGDWSRQYRNHPLPGSSLSTVAVWAATHEGRVAQWRAIVAKREATRTTMAALRKGWFGSTSPRYVAEFADGKVARVSFWQAKGKAYDFARGRKVAIGSSGKTITRGFVEHDIPGGEFVRIEDPMTVTEHKVTRPSYKAALAALVEAMGPAVNDSSELAKAYRTAVHALGMQPGAAMAA